MSFLLGAGGEGEETVEGSWGDGTPTWDYMANEKWAQGIIYKKIGEEAGLRNGKTVAKQKMCRDTYIQEVHFYVPEVI